MTSFSDKTNSERVGEPRLRIELLGPFRITYAGREIDLQARKSRAIIVCLAMADDWRLPRERIYGLLWSEADGARAKASLRTAIYDLRGVLDAALPGAFGADKHTLWLDRTKVEIDLWQALEGARVGRPTAPLIERERVTENILADCEGVDPSFSEWLTAKRQSLHTRLMMLLEDSLRQHPIGATDAQIEPLARAIMRLDPTHEEAVRAMIRARAAVGDLGGAFTLYKALWHLLETEFEIRPSKETQDLIAELRLAQPEGGETPPEPASARAVPLPASGAEATFPPPTPPKPAAARKLIINIGGFDASGVKADNRYLITGFRQELAACLVRFREWSVRDQAMMLAGTPPESSEDGAYVIDGSAFETSESVRLVLMLRDTRSGEYVWSERLLLSVQNWLEAQQQTVRRIATALNVNISAERLSVKSELTLKDHGAHDQWLRAQALLSTREPASMDEALGICRRLISEYPTFAPAYIVLADYLNIVHINLPGTHRNRVRTAEALRLAREAVRLDPINSRAQLCLAWSFNMAGMPNEAHERASIAYELNDTDPWTRVSSINCQATAGVSANVGKLADAMIERGDLLLPRHWAYHTGTLFLTGRYEEVLRASELAAGVFYTTPAWRAAALAQLGRFTEARAALAAFLSTVKSKWIDPLTRTDEAIATWYLQAHPIQHEDAWQRMKSGLTDAGLAHVSMTHAQAMLR